MAYLNKNNYKIYYEVIGKGKPLVYLHGLGGNIEAIKGIYRKIENVQLILIDLQGHGQSTMSDNDFNFKTLAKDVVDVVDCLKIDKFMIAGISMGAAVGLRVAIDYPSRIDKLILIRNAWINKPMKQEFINIYEQAAHYLSLDDLLGFEKTKEFKELEKLSKNSVGSLRYYFTDNAALKNYTKFSTLPKLKPFNKWEEIENLDIETLIINNDNDPIHASEYGKEIAKHMKNVTYKEILSKDVNAIEHVRQLNRQLKDFINAK